MKTHRHAEGRQASTAPEKKRHNEEIDNERAETSGMNDPLVLDDPVEQRIANLLLQPRSQWLAMQPVRRNFRDPGEEIDHAHLCAQ